MTSRKEPLVVASFGDNEIARICEEILREEEAMAEWLKNYLEGLTDRYAGDIAMLVTMP
jgi:ferritin-like metal-binding protein YciE